ncbi:ferredoxin-thioredoxin reductase catalytic subunit [Methanocalculus alkaliphilus]|uniref:ferredoxin-thioredoxin reductase catalytic domain-containing protein n=1 Tax=Methanocalculus alkaliphilus TaxID=768730 RepID=UPI00209E8C5D|nr:ferredoxin-thioredoxin reductase catalytic domain-containing protein [Methanocalculus alkaliphilus]MCP1714471.1 ferredoxin-thioredoxin reductase catalytic subunit [Methanocalculus alkaliphilus]
MTPEPTEEEIATLEEMLGCEAEAHGYHLTPDKEALHALLKGLITNSRRYGYPACPCRLSFGKKEEDIDIICPCDYRDQDIDEYGACYCSLYVSKKVLSGEEAVECIPERRPPRAERKKESVQVKESGFSLPIWRCRVCGYLCARKHPPETCPICGVDKDRFERFA